MFEVARRQRSGSATFSLYAPRLAPGLGFLVAAGLEDCLRYLEDFRNHVVAVAPLAVLAEQLAVVRGEDHETPLVEPPCFQVVDETAEAAIDATYATRSETIEPRMTLGIC